MIVLSEEVKKEIRDSKPFLLKLYHAKSKYQKKKLLQAASSQELQVIIKILHYIANKEISIRHSKIEHLKKSKRLPYLKATFENEKKSQKLLDGKKKNQIAALMNVGHFSHLLYSLFFEK